MLFEDFGEDPLFMRLLAWALGRSPICTLFVYCLMPLEFTGIFGYYWRPPGT